MTNAGPEEYLGGPYQTTSVISSYRDRQSSIIGALLIIAGSLSIIFSIVESATLETFVWIDMLSGIMVSIPLITLHSS